MNNLLQFLFGNNPTHKTDFIQKGELNITNPLDFFYDDLCDSVFGLYSKELLKLIGKEELDKMQLYRHIERPIWIAYLDELYKIGEEFYKDEANCLIPIYNILDNAKKNSIYNPFNPNITVFVQPFNLSMISHIPTIEEYTKIRQERK